MPEVVEVETIRRQIAPIVGKLITRLRSPTLRFTLPIERVQSCVIRNVTRFGKYLFLDIGDSYLAIHLGMSGSLRLQRRYVEVKHDHLIFELSNGSILTYNDPRRFGRITLVPRYLLPQLHEPSDVKVGLPYYGLGIDALGWHMLDATMPMRIKTWRYAMRDSCGPLKHDLLNQGFVAGIGNIYASELCWRTKLLPTRLVKTFDQHNWRSIAYEHTHLMHTALQDGGTTFKGANQFKSAFGSIGKFQPDVYARAGQPCCRCQTPIKSLYLEGRNTFYCPTCQE